jgi:hypothetical protein
MQGLGTALRSISRGKSPSQDRDRSGLCVGRRFLTASTEVEKCLVEAGSSPTSKHHRLYAV